jgi:hypothetical protein
VFLTVALSVFAHGATAAPLAERYADWLETQPEGDRAPVESGEGEEDEEVRWRLGAALPAAHAEE